MRSWVIRLAAWSAVGALLGALAACGLLGTPGSHVEGLRATFGARMIVGTCAGMGVIVALLAVLAGRALWMVGHFVGRMLAR